MTYVAIALYALGVFMTYRFLLKSLIETGEVRDLFKANKNKMRQAKIALKVVTFFFALQWPVRTIIGYGKRMYRKLRRLISKKK